MKNTGLLSFMFVFLVMIAVSFAFGSYDPITTAVPQAQTAMVIGSTATNWLETAWNWLIGLAVGGIFTGMGVAAFREISKAYKLWKRNSQAGRWQAGPNAQFQRQPSQSPRVSVQDKLLLALAGRIPTNERSFIQPVQQPNDDLYIDI